MTEIRKGFGAFCYPPLTIYDGHETQNEMGLADQNKRKTKGNFLPENEIRAHFKDN